MTLEFLDKMDDEELLRVRARADELLKAHDTERKAKAVADARALKEKAQAEARELLASVGLSLKAVAPKKRHAKRGENGTAQASALNVTRKTG